MRQVILFLLCLEFVMMSLCANAQEKTTWEGLLHFDSQYGIPSAPTYGIWIDSAQTTGWHIGKPVKSVFNMARSPARVLATDTAAPYPPNDTAVFVIKQLAMGGWGFPQVVSLDGWYWVNSDTLSDYGKVEVSPDDGLTWIDLMQDTPYNIYTGYSPYCDAGESRPVFSGNSGGWKYFKLRLCKIAQAFNVNFQDTVQFRFTFISDGVHTAKDGLMFDDLRFHDWASGIDNVEQDALTAKSYPNPASDLLRIDVFSTRFMKWQGMVYNEMGQAVKEIPSAPGPTLQVIVAGLPPGLYTARIWDDKRERTIVARFTIAR